MKCDWFSLNWYRNAHVLGFYKLQFNSLPFMSGLKYERKTVRWIMSSLLPPKILCLGNFNLIKMMKQTAL